jgi:hypothetical protein
MVNTNIQSPIPLVGRGYAQRPSMIYDTGEYPRLNNVFVTERGLEGRFGISKISDVFYNDAELSQYTDLCGFIGSMSYSLGGADAAVVMGRETVLDFSKNESLVDTPYQGNDSLGWVPADLQLTQTNGTNQVPVKVFNYRDINYFLTQELTGGDTIEYHFGPEATGGVIPDLTSIISGRTLGGATYDFVDSFVFKDRLWVITRNTIYFSAVGPASLTNFTAPDGGAFIYSDNIKAVEASKDTLYVICENEVYALTYGDDPNLDSTNLIISTDQGGDSSCTYEGTIYFTDGMTLFAVSSNSITTVMELELFQREPRSGTGNFSDSLFDRPAISTKLVPFKDKLYLIYYEPCRFSADSGSTDFINRGAKLPFQSVVTDQMGNVDKSDFSNVFAISMTNGSITRIVLTELHDFNRFGCIVDATELNNGDGSSVLLFMTSTHRYSATSPTNVNSTYNFVYSYTDEPEEYAEESNQSHTVYDSLATFQGGSVANGRLTYNVPYQVTIKDFFPDGNEYMMKKFRSLNIMGNLPHGIIVNAHLDSRDAVNQLGVISDLQDVLRDPNPYRFGIMARAKSLSLAISSPLVYVEDTPGVTRINHDRLIIHDMRVLWTYTGKPQNTIVSS